MAFVIEGSQLLRNRNANGKSTYWMIHVPHLIVHQRKLGRLMGLLEESSRVGSSSSQAQINSIYHYLLLDHLGLFNYAQTADTVTTTPSNGLNLSIPTFLIMPAFLNVLRAPVHLSRGGIPPVIHSCLSRALSSPSPAWEN
jgi:hypothetical protein